MKIVSRAEWGATVPQGPPMPGVPSEVWLHWTVTPSTPDAVADMKLIEAIGKQRFGRFSYSYVYHPPTRLWLEGAGRTVGAHTAGRNSRALGLSVIAQPGDDHMPHYAEDTAELIRHLIDTGRLQPGDYPTAGHRDQKPTQCPGDYAYSQIDTIRSMVRNGPKPQGGGFMADLTEKEQREALEILRRLDNEWGKSLDDKAKPPNGNSRWKLGKMFLRSR